VTWIFFALANTCLLVSMVIYLTKIFRGSTTTSPVTWGITFAAMALSNATYYFVVHGNLKEQSPALIGNIAVLIVFVHSIIHYRPNNEGKRKLSNLDVLILFFALLVTLFWYMSRNANTANVLIQIINLLSFIPTLRGLKRKELHDHPLPWLLAVTGYGFQILTIISNPEPWSWYALVAPVMSGILGSGSVCVTSWWMNRKHPFREVLA
jgi:hypothetical protein